MTFRATQNSNNVQNNNQDVTSMTTIAKIARTNNGGIIPKVTISFLQANSRSFFCLMNHNDLYYSDSSFEKGLQYYNENKVAAIIVDGPVIKSRVNGSNPNEPYDIEIYVDLMGERVTKCVCTCPYQLEGWCKHVSTEKA
jgi:uncharacterized Zn finger protein